MPLTDKTLEKLRKSVRLHLNWFIASILGEDALTELERVELRSFKKLPKKSLNLSEKSFLLGRLKALLKKSEWKKLTFEELLSEHPDLSPVEKLAVQQAKLRAAKHIKGLADDIAEGIYDSLARHTGMAVDEATVQGIIQDEVALGALERKHYTHVASSLAQRTHTAYGYRWKMIARTELHSAKVQGVAQAIANKIDIYKNSQGVDSSVSVVPHPDCCQDCSHQFVDANGNPKVFRLRDLMSAGSNANRDHSRAKGLHHNWAATLPPLHPNCRCELIFVPPGYSWQGSKLSLTNPQAFSKAIGDSALSATVKPKGPPQPSKPQPAASVPGLKAPQQAVAGGRPPGSGASGGGDPDTQPCPFGGGEECKRHGGNGAKTHKSGGSIMKAHMKALAQGAKADNPEAVEQITQQLKEDAVKWSKQEHPHSVKLAHLADGEITSIRKLDEGEKGIQDSFQVTIAGNGRGLLKPRQEHDAESLKDSNNSWTEGIHSVPHGRGHLHEAGAYHMHMALGLTDHVPATSTRVHGGKPSSCQHWLEDHKALVTHLKGVTSPSPSKRFDAILSSVKPQHQEKFLKKFKELTVGSIILNDNDWHMGNSMISEDGDLQGIDKTTTGANGLDGYKNTLLHDFAASGRKLTIPQDLHDRMKKTTLSDLQRAAGDHYEDWQVGQSFLRMQYVMHLQETEGHLDSKKFELFITDASGSPTLHPTMKKKIYTPQQMDEAIDRVHEGTTPHHLFQGFAKAWLEKHSADESSPHHEAAKQLQDIGVFMPSGTDMFDPKATRAAGKHREYEKTIEAKWPEEVLPATRFKAKTRATADLSTAPVGRRKARKPATVDESGTVSEKKKKSPPPEDNDMATAKAKKIRKGLFITNIHKAFGP